MTDDLLLGDDAFQSFARGTCTRTTERLYEEAQAIVALVAVFGCMVVWAGGVFAIGYFAYDPTGICIVLMNCGLSAGLLLVTLADIDINRSMKRVSVQFPVRTMIANLVIIITFVLLSIIFTGTPQDRWYFAIVALPAMYYCFRTQQILNMEPGYPSFTFILTLALALFLAVNGITQFLGVLQPTGPPPHWVESIKTVLFLVGGLVMVPLYMCPPWPAHTLSLRFLMTMFLVNFIVGISFLLEQLEDNVLHYYTDHGGNNDGPWDHFATKDERWPVFSWFSGPIHIIPTLGMLCYPRHIHGWLGVRWLKQRLSKPDADDALTEEMKNIGMLGPVEEAITNKADMNRFARSTDIDGYTLLMLACWANNPEVVQRILLHGEVDPRLGSKDRGWTALYISARLSHVSCAQLLIEHGVDVNQPVRDGQTALFISAARGHSEMVDLLGVNGATNVPWMGLTPSAGEWAPSVSVDPYP
jgi:hypothetical protein